MQRRTALQEHDSMVSKKGMSRKLVFGFKGKSRFKGFEARPWWWLGEFCWHIFVLWHHRWHVLSGCAVTAPCLLRHNPQDWLRTLGGKWRQMWRSTKASLLDSHVLQIALARRCFVRHAEHVEACCTKVDVVDARAARMCGKHFRMVFVVFFRFQVHSPHGLTFFICRLISTSEIMTSPLGRASKPLNLDFPLKTKTSFRLVPFFETIESRSGRTVQSCMKLTGAHRNTVA
jgi:hypothetical protein